MWSVDWQTRRVHIVEQSGKTYNEPMSASERMPSAQVVVTSFDWDNWLLLSVTDRGQVIPAEVWTSQGDPLAGRPSVYLDQGHWSTIAKTLVRPGDVSAADTDAVARLSELAYDGGIILPLSSATLQETAQLFGERRHEVGVAIAALSHGWQLMDPVTVRTQEFTTWFAHRLAIAPPAFRMPVVTLVPGAVFGDRIHQLSRFGASAGTQELLDALTWPAVMLSILLDPEAILDVPPARWAQANQDFARRVARLPKARRQAATTAAAIADNEKLMRTALTLLGNPDELVNRLGSEGLAQAVRTTEFGGLYTDLMSERLRDPNRVWRTNDLNDMMFLACAAAYCDHVVAERQTGRQLQRIQARTGLRQSVVTSLPDVVAALEKEGVQTASERSEAK